MKYKRILAFGDIHGNYDKFINLWRKVQVHPEEDLAIFLGDYIDRGSGSVPMLQWIMEKSQQENIIALRGNHEQMMIDYLRGRDLGWAYEGNSGQQTLMDFLKETIRHPGRRFLKNCLTFAESLPLYHEMEIGGTPFLFVHAGVNPAKERLEENTLDELLWIRSEFYTGYTGTRKIVAGHTPTSYIKYGCTKPLLLPNNIILLDTGSFLSDGRISCINVLNDEIWQSDFPVEKKKGDFH